MISLHTDPAALPALAPAWIDLWHRTPTATPFSHPLWLLPWWHQWGTPYPRIATLHQSGRLTAILPLYILHEPTGPKLLPIGAGTTDYCDALAEPGTDLAPLLAAALDTPGLTRCDLIDIPAHSPLLTLTPPPGWHATYQQTASCPVLPAGHSIPAPTRRKLRMARHRADRIGGWHVTEATAATLPDHLATLIRLHQSRWQSTGEPGVLADPKILAFHAEATPALFAAGLLRLPILHLGGQPAAALLQLTQPGRTLFYLPGHDTTRPYHSPGTLLLGWALDQAATEANDAHFLRGAEPYKFAWGAEDRPNHTLSLTAGTTS